MGALGSVIRRRWKAILLLSALLGGGLIAGASFASPQTSVAEALIRLHDPSSEVAGGELAPLLAPEMPEYGLASPDTFLRSRAVLRLAGAELKKVPEAVASSVQIERSARGGEVFRVRGEAANPADAVTLVNAFARSAIVVARARSAEVLARAEKKLAERRREARARFDAFLAAIDADESQVRERERRLGALSAAAAEVERQTEEVRARQERSLLRIRDLEAVEHRLREALPVGAEEDGLTSPVLEKLRAEMDAIRTEIAVQRLAKTPESPEYKRRTARLGELQEEVRAELYRVRAKTIAALRETVREAEAELRALDERRLRKQLDIQQAAEEARREDPRRAEIAALRKDLEGDEDLGRRLLRARASAPAIEEAAEEGVVARGRLAGWLPLGIVLAIGAAFAVACLLERADARIRTDSDVKRALNLPSLALIEQAPIEDPYIYRMQPQEPLSEAFSMAATLFRSYLAEREFKSCVVTSAGAEEGKTTVASNLAVALARKGLNVALLDCDFRAPRLHEVFVLDNAKGLSTLLLGGEDPEFFLQPTELPTLSVLTSGPTEELPPEIFESQRMTDFLRALRERYDVILCDAPPLGGAGDGLTLARLTDTALWVIRSGKSDRRTLGWTKHLLKNVRADVAGVVLNFAPDREGVRFYSYPVQARPA